MEPLYQRYLNETVNKQGEVVDFSLNVPDNFIFAYDVVDELANRNPGAPALMWRSEDGTGDHVYTFEEIKENSDKAAAAFLKQGIKKGDVVMLILRRHYSFWFAVMGLNKIGAVAVPATNQLLVKDLDYRFNAADVKGVVCIDDGKITDYIDEAQKTSPTLQTKWVVGGKQAGWLSFEDELENAPEFVKPKPEDLQTNEDTMLLYFTSGTTGMPKMVSHDNTYPIAHIITAKYWHKVSPGKPHLTVSETGWAKSVWGKLYGQWFMEAVVYAYDMERFNAHNLLSHIEKDKVATFCAPVTIYRMLIHEDLSKYDLSSLQHATVAGEALNAEVFNKFYQYTGLKLMEGFGQTETTLTVATFYWMKPKPGSMGRPVKTSNVQIVDEDGKQRKAGVVGEIVLKIEGEKPVGMFKGYHKDPNRTSQVWHDGIYHTGDMAWQDEDGYIFYMSRTDDIIKSSGYRIGPFEVESVLMEHEAVIECAVTGVPDPVRGMAVKATIVLVKGFTPSEELAKDIQEYVKTHTAPYKYPRVVEFVEELPKTISGKIRRVEIRAKDDTKE